MLPQLEATQTASQFIRAKSVRRDQQMEMYLVERLDSSGRLLEQWEPIGKLHEYMLHLAEVKQQAILAGTFIPIR